MAEVVVPDQAKRFRKALYGEFHSEFVRSQDCFPVGNYLELDSFGVRCLVELQGWNIEDRQFVGLRIARSDKNTFDKDYSTQNTQVDSNVGSGKDNIDNQGNIGFHIHRVHMSVHKQFLPPKRG